MPDLPSINTARVVVNQSNIVNTGGSNSESSSSGSSESIVDSDAARLVVHRSLGGLAIVSLDVKPGWEETTRSESPEELVFRYVSGSSTVDIRVWSNGSGISSSVSSSFDR